jgi:hypothetical protein
VGVKRVWRCVIYLLLGVCLGLMVEWEEIGVIFIVGVVVGV